MRGRESYKGKKPNIEKKYLKTSEHSKMEQEKMDRMLENFVDHYYKKDNITLRKDGRIKQSQFYKCFDSEKMKRDRAYAQRKEMGIKEDRGQKEQSKESEYLEQLVPIIFTKVMPDKFITLRASRYDDYKNGVDTLLIDRESGDAVCFIDEVTVEEGPPRRKIKDIIQRNITGTYIDYSYEQDENGKFIPSSRNISLPVCYLSLERKNIPKIIAGINESISDVTEQDKSIFNRFVADLRISLEYIEEYALAKTLNSDPRVAAVDKEFKDKVTSLTKLFKSLQA